MWVVAHLSASYREALEQLHGRGGFDPMRCKSPTSYRVHGDSIYLEGAELVDCVGMLFMGVCRLLGTLVGSLWNVSVCFFMGVWRLLGRLVDSLWNVSVCFLWVCGGCLRDWSVACGMFRYAFYGCVSAAWEVASNAYPWASLCLSRPQ